MERLRKLLNREEGFSLIELLVVVAILGVLATLTAVAVTGTTSSSKSVTKVGDEATVTKGAASYSAEEAGARFPTLDGCLPGTALKLSTLTCLSTEGTGDPVQRFRVDESALGLDVDGDGELASADVKLVPIIWNQSFTASDGSVKTFKGDFVATPKHAFELRNKTTSFKTTTGVRPEDGTSITGVPTTGDIAVCDAASVSGFTTGDLTKCPVWALNEFGEAVALLAGSAY